MLQDIVAMADEQLAFQKGKEDWKVQRGRETAKLEEKMVASFLDHEQKPREEDRVQQKDPCERLLVLIATRQQVPTLANTESRPCYHFLQPVQPLDNSGVPWAMKHTRNSTSTDIAHNIPHQGKGEQARKRHSVSLPVQL